MAKETQPKMKTGNTTTKGTGKAKFENGKLVLPTPVPAVDINTKVEPEQQVVIGGMNLNGSKPEKKKNSKRSKMEMTKKQKGAVSHPVNSDLLPLLPKGWKNTERDGYVVVSDDKGVERMHSRDCLSKEYFSLRILPEKVSKIKTVAELESIVQKSVSAKSAKKEQ